MGEDMNEHKIDEIKKDVAEIKDDLKDYQRDNEKWKRGFEDRAFQSESRIHLIEKNMEDIKGLLKFIRNSVITIIIGGLFALMMSLGG